MNVKLLRKVKKHILAEPKRLVMWTWKLQNTLQPKFLSDGYGNMPRKFIPFAECGTAACIAGWTCLLSGKKNVEGNHISQTAIQLLGIPGSLTNSLFVVTFWPGQFRAKYHNAKTQKTRAKIAAERIEHFISTKGAE